MAQLEPSRVGANIDRINGLDPYVKTRDECFQGPNDELARLREMGIAA
jgi:hypothetical protein